MDTYNLENKLFKSNTYKDFDKTHGQDLKSITPSEFIKKIITYKKLHKPNVIKATNMSSSYAYELLNGIKKPSRDKMICFALALALTFNECQLMFKTCGYPPLYAKNKRDSIIIFCIHRKKGVISTNLLLDEYHQELI